MCRSTVQVHGLVMKQGISGETKRVSSTKKRKTREKEAFENTDCPHSIQVWEKLNLLADNKPIFLLFTRNYFYLGAFQLPFSFL